MNPTFSHFRVGTPGSGTFREHPFFHYFTHLFNPFLLLFIVSLPAFASQQCTFNRFAAQPKPYAPVSLKEEGEFATAFRSRLAQGLKEEADFAGTLTLVTWGCGTGCIQGGVVDHASGKAVELPFTLFKTPDSPVSPLIYRPDSRLLIATGSFSEEEEETSTRCYQWTNVSLNRLEHCECAPIPLQDLSLDRVQQEITGCGERFHDEKSFSDCLLAASRKDIETFKASVERVGGTWQMPMDPDDARLVSHFLHTSRIIFKLPAKAGDSLMSEEVAEWMHGTLWLVDHREKLRQDPDLFFRTQSTMPLHGVPGEHPVR